MPEGTLATNASKINIAKTEICCINNSFEEIEINDVLENILLLLKFITKTVIRQGFLGILKKKLRHIYKCLICLIFLYTVQMTWYERVLKKNIKEIFSSGILYVCILIILSIQHFFLGNSFSWVWIEPIEQPSIFVRIFYSAITYPTLGYLVYRTGFYLFIWRIFPRRIFRGIKKKVWIILIGVMFFVVVPIVVDVLNGIISIFYNIFNFFLYLFPAVAISSLIVVGILYLRNKKTRPTVLNIAEEKLS